MLFSMVVSTLVFDVSLHPTAIRADVLCVGGARFQCLLSSHKVGCACTDGADKFRAHTGAIECSRTRRFIGRSSGVLYIFFVFFSSCFSFKKYYFFSVSVCFNDRNDSPDSFYASSSSESVSSPPITTCSHHCLISRHTLCIGFEFATFSFEFAISAQAITRRPRA